MSKQEKTPSGEPIYRHEESKKKDFEFAIGNEQSIELISNHIEKYVGSIESVFHEIVSDIVHVDIHWVKPSSSFPFHTFVTSGMSDMPMIVPDGYDKYKYAELCILLPSHWDIHYEKFKLMEDIFRDETSYWPIRWLKYIARFPHEYETWLGFGHTIPNGETAEPFASNTMLGCMLIMPSLSLPIEFSDLKVSETKSIKFYCLYPLYKEEMDFKLTKGVDALLDKFDKFGIRDVIDTKRPNCCIKKGLFGLW